jgi:hypothetical protein
MSVADLVAGLRESRGFRHKTDIAGVVSSLARRLPGGASDLDQSAVRHRRYGERFRAGDAVVRGL